MTRSPIFTAAAALWRDAADEWAVLSESEYNAAVVATNGNMVNARGAAAGWDSWSLFHATRTVREAYATPELLDHLREHPRTSREAFERTYVEGRITA